MAAAAGYVRAKRATAPLDAAARARLRGDEVMMGGYDSSGSEHAALSGLVYAFFESEAGGGDAADGVAAASVAAAAVEDSDGGEDSDPEDGDGDRTAKAAEEVKRLLGAAGKGDSFRIRLTADVSAAVEALSAFQKNRSAFRRAVMARLRECGYNAGLCKARWNGSKGIAAGNYEYIDVVVLTADDGVESSRYIIDVAFAAEFELARATEEYGQVAAALPVVAVARPEEVRRAVKAVAKAARRSLHSRGLSVPPWRKRRFMAAKWLGPYRRTTNPLPASAGAAAVAAAGGGDVVCRAVGFAAPLPEGGSPCYYYYH